MLCTLYAVWAIQFYKEHIIHIFDIPLPLDRHCNQHTCLRRKLRTVYSAYGVEEDRVTVRASPALTVSFGDSGQYRALFSYDRKTIETRLHYYWKHRLHNPTFGVHMQTKKKLFVAYSAHFHTFCQHYDSLNVTLPNHPPIVVNRVLQRSCKKTDNSRALLAKKPSLPYLVLQYTNGCLCTP